MKQKQLYIVYWYDTTGYTEFIELWSTELQAEIAANKYQDSWKDSNKTFVFEAIELIK
jgi:hypothetical protein